MYEEIKKMMDEMDALLAELEKLPKGSLVTHKRKNDHCYYGHQFKDPDTKKRRERYIPLADFPFWRALFDRRAVVKLRLKDLKSHLKKHKKEVKYLRTEEHEARLAAEELHQQEVLHGDTYKAEECNLYTLAGEFVRSGSELALANHLYIKGIKYVYEPRLYTPLGLLLSDFTVIASGKLIYIEHLGLLNDDEYRRNWDKKLKKYESIGIFEGKNLLCTTETPEGYMNFDEIDRLLRKYGIIE